MCGRYLWLFWDIDHALTPQNVREIGNRKANKIIALLKSSYASARFPTASYCTENEGTPVGSQQTFEHSLFAQGVLWTMLIRLIANAAAFWIFSVPKWGGITRLPAKVARSCRSWAKFTHRCGVATPFVNQPDKHALDNCGITKARSGRGASLRTGVPA